ncbi:MAG: iron-sulfur protein [Deltaproteobacteria bacterium HGW-Deltaproteobacteria-2]|jgi:multimeric flavodoxin WrbA|nr:MAG: iron-sulfur protein [Deltaproteobacteria bacterium HGW-Deltaproteobacteria-2]
MKIIGINASPRGSKSQTKKLVKAVLDGARSQGAAVELVDLCRLKMEYCNACGICYETGKCVHKDDLQVIYKNILSADGLVMGSPNYFHSVTAQMKTMLDRMSDTVHCQLLTGKYTVNIATSGGPGHYKQVLDYLNEIMLNFGSFITGSTGISAREGVKAFANTGAKAFRLGEILANDISKKKTYSKQNTRFKENRKYFQDLVKLNKNEWTNEYKYWDKLNWK